MCQFRPTREQYKLKCRGHSEILAKLSFKSEPGPTHRMGKTNSIQPFEQRSPRQLRFAWLPPSGTDNPRAYDTAARHNLRVGLLIFYILTAMAYFSWRSTVFNPDAPVFSALFYAAELFSFIVCFLISFAGWRRCYRKPPSRPETGLTVDVFVTAYNEPLNVIRRTTVAAVNIEYPHQTWLLDDGNRSELKALADELGCHYLTRRTNQGAKAGNLNNALKHTAGEFIAVFDADHVAEPGFLTKLLGYFSDAKVSLVQTPQDFFNTNAFQYFSGNKQGLCWHDMSEFHYVGQPGRHYWNAVTFCGSSAILRRKAIEEIGGFPEETVTEDMHASVRMQKLGYKHIYHPESLAFGIAPVGFREYLRQRIRWGEGNMHVCRAEHIPFTNGLSWHQRFCYGALSWLYWAAWQRLAFYAAPIILLFLQIAPISSDPATFAAFFIPYILMSYLVFEEVTRGFGRFFKSEQSGNAQLLSGLIATTALLRRKIVFRVASKELSGKTPLPLLLPQILITALSITAVCYALTRYLFAPPLGMSIWLALFVAGFALINARISYLVIKNARRVANLSGGEYLHEIALPLQLKYADGKTHFTVSEAISIETVKFSPNQQTDQSQSPLQSITLFLPGFAVECRVSETKQHRAADSGSMITATLNWPDLQTRDRLDQTLHTPSWYRPLNGYHESVPTPYDRLRDFIDNGTFKSQISLQWEPALFTQSADQSSKHRLCFICPNHARTNNNPAILTFEPLVRGTCLNLTNAGRQRKYVKIGTRISGLLHGEDALSRSGGVMYLMQNEIYASKTNKGKLITTIDNTREVVL